MRLATAAQVREMDRRAIEERGIPSLTLMERAAQGILEAVEELMEEDVSYRPESRGEVCMGDKSFPFTCGGAPSRKAAVFAGPGNNGGDGVAVAGLLLQRGWQVRCFLTGPREKMTADCRSMAERLEGLGGTLEDYCPGNGEQIAWTMGADVVVDAIFGVGLHSPLRQPAASAVALINSAPGPVVSADMPSGVESDTGRILGDGVEATVTVTFSLAKIGLFVGDGALRAGRVIVHPIGIPEELCPEGCPVDTVEPWMVRSWLPRRPADGHKGTFGRAYLLCGSAAYTGAPVLAARAAGRGGCGLVTVGVPASAWSPVAARCLEEMPQALPEKDGMLSKDALPILQKQMDVANAVLIGPGLGRSEEAEETVRRLAADCPAPLVLDADGINAFSGHIDELDARRDRATVLTPHDGEFARLGGDLSAGRLEGARAFALRHGCVLVLKGHRTIVAAPDGRCYVNTTGNSGMAKGGSGDVLAGLLTALLAQGMAPAEAAAAAVWLHGRAGDLAAAELTAYAMAAGDLIRFFPAAFREICGGK